MYPWRTRRTWQHAATSNRQNQLGTRNGLHQDQPGLQKLPRRENGTATESHGLASVRWRLQTGAAPGPDWYAALLKEASARIRQLNERAVRQGILSSEESLGEIALNEPTPPTARAL